MNTARQSRLVAALAVLLVLAGLIAWSNSYSIPFLLDDAGSIQENPSIRDLSSLRAILAPPAGETVQGRPLVNLSFGINYALGGIRVAGYHGLNLAFHLVTGLLLFRVLLLTLASPRAGPGMNARATPAAFLVTLLWLVHPLQTAAVTYLVQRAEVMASLFYLLALDASARSFLVARRRLWWRVVAVAACIAGIASKETAISVPLMILLYDRTFCSGSLREAIRRSRGFYAALGGAFIAMSGWVLAIGSRANTAGFALGIAPLDYAVVELTVVARYLGLVLWPSPLVFDYGRGFVPGPADVVASGMLVAFLIVLALRELARNTPAGFCGALFLAVLAPTSSFFPLVDPYFEHRMYLPLAAVVSLAALVAFDTAVRLAGRRGEIALVAIFSLLAVVLVELTRARNGDFRTEEAIWRDTVAKRPQSARAHRGLSDALFKKGAYDEAERHALLAVQADPRFGQAWFNLGLIRLKRDRPSGAAAAFDRARSLDPSDPKTLYNLGKALVEAGEVSNGLLYLEQAFSSGEAPTAAYQVLADALVRAGRGPEAARYYRFLVAAATQSGDFTLAREAEAKLAVLQGASGP